MTSSIKLPDGDNLSFIQPAPAVDLSGMHLTNSIVVLQVMEQIPTMAGGKIKLNSKDTEDYAKLGNVGRVLKVGPRAFLNQYSAVTPEEMVGKFALFNPYTGYQIKYKGARLSLVDDFNIRFVLDNITDLDREFVLSTF